MTDERDTVPAPPTPSVNPVAQERERLEKQNMALKLGIDAAIRALKSGGIPSVTIQRAIYILEGAHDSSLDGEPQ